MRLKVLLTAAMLVASPATAQQQPPAMPDASSAEIARVRAALEKPPPILTPPDRKADFSVHIEKRLPLQEIFDTPPWATPPVGGWGSAGFGSGTPSSTLISFDVLPMLQAAVQSARRAYAEHAAREEVKRAIAGYCAAQPNAGAGIQICAASSVGR